MSHTQDTSSCDADAHQAGKTDRISELPDEVMYNILLRSTNTVRRIVELSTVSRTWKQLCGCIPIFNYHLDWVNLFGTQQNRRSWIKGTDPCRGFEDQFARAVNQLIEFHKSPEFATFPVRFCLGMESASDIDSWVRFALSKGVRSLSLHLSCKLCPKSKEKGTYVFHLDHLGEGEVNTRLRKLSLRCCVLGQGWTKQLSCLQKLVLSNVTVRQPEIESILSCCSNLRTLCLRACVLPAELCISGKSAAMGLRILTLRFCLEVQTIELFAPRLLDLEYFGGSTTFSTLEVPSLRRLFIRARPGSEATIMKSLLSKTPPAHVLTVVAPTNWVHNLPEGMPCKNVIELHLNSPEEMDLDVSKINVILKACPRMEVLSLAIKRFSGEIKSPVTYVHRNLKTVKLYGFSRIWDQIEFVIYLLECAALKSMIIDPESVVKNGLTVTTFTKCEEAWCEEDRRKIRVLLHSSLKSTVLKIY